MIDSIVSISEIPPFSNRVSLLLLLTHLADLKKYAHLDVVFSLRNLENMPCLKFVLES